MQNQEFYKNNVIPFIQMWCPRYFDALAKGETPPVKDRLETQLGQPLEKPLTQGLLAVLHKQVWKICLFIKFYLLV